METRRPVRKESGRKNEMTNDVHCVRVCRPSSSTFILTEFHTQINFLKGTRPLQDIRLDSICGRDARLGLVWKTVDDEW